MKRLLSGLLCALLAAALVACAGQPQGQSGQVAQVQPRPPQSAAFSTAAQPAEIALVLPAGRDDLAEILARLAAADGNTLRLVRLPSGVEYTNRLARQLAEEAGADLFWIEGEADAQALQAHCEDLAGPGVAPSTYALAQMVPQGARLLDDGSVWGLPLGYYAQGYLVNLELLAALLGTSNLTGLRDDLNQCDWPQWSTLVRMLDAYLLKPATYVIRLGSGNYTTPAYRPTEAQQLRGIFAVPTQDAAALADGALDKALVVAFGNHQRYEETGEEQMAEQMWPGLSAMASLLNLETTYMTAKDGPLRRGEDYAAREKIDLAGAQELFAAGTALFLRADSTTGFAMERENPALSGYLALVPLKMPPPEEEEEEDAASSSQATEAEAEDDSAAASSVPDDSSASTPPDAGEAPEPDGYDVAEGIEEANKRLVFGSDGYLCMHSGAKQPQAAQALLLRLFTTEEGLNAIQDELLLLPFSRLYPASGLQSQVAGALSGQGLAQLVPASGLARTKGGIGTFVRDELLLVAEWTEEEQLAYFSACYNAFGIYIDIDLGELEPAG